MVLPKSFPAHDCLGSRTSGCYKRNSEMNQGSALGRSRNDGTVEGRTGEIRCEARCLREIDAEENSTREIDMSERYAGAGSSSLEASAEYGPPTNDGPCATKTTVERTLPPEL